MRISRKKNYLLLLQGQLVSTLGDAIYTIALSLWVLKISGSTAMVGTIMGIIMVPRVLLGPFAGAYVDRHSKKKIIVYTDLIRGVAILFIAGLAYYDKLHLWCLFMVAVIDGICTSFFNPSMESIMPELVQEENLVQLRSLFEMSKMGMDVLGQTVGGLLYSMLGAPMMFFINGFSYIFSSGTEHFISENRKIQQSKIDYYKDIKEGFKYIAKSQGLLLLILMSFLFNLLFGMVRVLIVPWFAMTGGFGEAKFGFFNGACSIGMVIGMLFLSLVRINEKHKYIIYIASVEAFVVLIFIAAWSNQYYTVLIGFALAFTCMAIFNTILATTVVLNTVDEMRGKVSATKLTLCMAASPLGNFVGGLLGECLDARITIMIVSCFAAVAILPFILNNEVRDYMSVESTH